jgi:hypothetical protein
MSSTVRNITTMSELIDMVQAADASYSAQRLHVAREHVARDKQHVARDQAARRT